jgi:hypothetical protein
LNALLKTKKPDELKFRKSKLELQKQVDMKSEIITREERVIEKYESYRKEQFELAEKNAELKKEYEDKLFELRKRKALLKSFASPPYTSKKVETKVEEIDVPVKDWKSTCIKKGAVFETKWVGDKLHVLRHVFLKELWETAVYWSRNKQTEAEARKNPEFIKTTTMNDNFINFRCDENFDVYVPFRRFDATWVGSGKYWDYESETIKDVPEKKPMFIERKVVKPVEFVPEFIIEEPKFLEPVIKESKKPTPENMELYYSAAEAEATIKIHNLSRGNEKTIEDIPAWDSRAGLIEQIRKTPYKVKIESLLNEVPKARFMLKRFPGADLGSLYMMYKMFGKKKVWNSDWRKFVYNESQFKKCHLKVFFAAIYFATKGKPPKFLYSVYLYDKLVGKKSSMDDSKYLQIKREKPIPEIMNIYVGDWSSDDEKAKAKGIKEIKQQEMRPKTKGLRRIQYVYSEYFKPEYIGRLNMKIMMYNSFVEVLRQYKHNRTRPRLIVDPNLMLHMLE